MLSASARLVLITAGIAALVVATLGASLYLWARKGVDHEVRRDLAVQTGMFRERFLEEYDEVKRGVHSDLGAEMDTFLQVSGAEADVRREDGTLLYASKGFPSDPETRLVTEVPLRVSEDEEFKARVFLSETAYGQEMTELLVFFAVFTPVVLGVALLVGYILVKRTLSPVEEIRQQAERISRQNVSERIHQAHSKGEFHRLARTFNEMLSRLECAMEDLNHFADDAAHELKTPLAKIRWEIESAVQGERTPEEYQAVLGSVGEEVAILNQVVGNLLTMARIERGQHAFQKGPLELRHLLEEIREAWQGPAKSRGITILVEGEPTEIIADPSAIRRVVMNLAENAVRYNREGGTITLAVDRRNGRARVSVRDTGQGIAAEHLPRLFRRFYRADQARSRDQGGTGLGLAVCKSFIEAHGGTIKVESASGQGSTFTLELPAE